MVYTGNVHSVLQYAKTELVLKRLVQVRSYTGDWSTGTRVLGTVLGMQVFGRTLQKPTKKSICPNTYLPDII